AGIRPAENSVAFDHIVICPEPVGDVSSATASYHSPYGLIRSDWNRNGDTFELDVTIPPNTDAVVYIPAGAGAKILKNGKRLDPHQVTTDGHGRQAISIGSGTYKFLVTE